MIKVSYNGFTGELEKLEKVPITCYGRTVYDLIIRNIEKHSTASFTGVKLEDVKFLGCEVSFG